jgi:protein SCO1/2
MRQSLFAAAAILASTLNAGPSAAHDAAHGAHDASPQARTAEAAAPMTPVEIKAFDYFSDVTLIDHEGRPQRLFSDLLRGRTVAVSLFFTECAGACPILNDMLAQVQERLGSRLGQDIFLLSITVDAANDDAATLAAYRERFDAAPGWRFLSGDAEAVAEVTRKFGHVLDKEAHLTTLLIGKPSEGWWRKVEPNAGPEVVAATLIDFAEGRGGPAR